MKLNRFILLNLIWVLLFFLCSIGITADESVEVLLKRAREEFYASVENKKRIEPAIKLFERIAREKPKYAGRAEVYMGTLVALKGKHAFFPHTKLKWTKRGLAIIDSGLKKAPEDIEALFIHGAVCYHLPFFFQRGDDAQRDFKEIIKQMPSQMHTYHSELVVNIITFLLEKAKLTDDEKVYLRALKDKLESGYPEAQQ
ncbi:hypothetical protein F4X10_09455 [Candidatus Poribacteria bacterium]|nr:hypothetical protein [Candidatus Poribacteria bacterium]